MGESRAESPESEWRWDTADGELLVHTDVGGRAARMGHRLTIAMTSWHATVRLADGQPAAAQVTVDIDGLQVLRGEGGVTPLSGPEKSVVRANALNCFEVRKYPQIRFQADRVEQNAAGYRLTGELEIHGVTRPHTVDVAVAEESGQLSARTEVNQRDFRMKPYSMLMGAMKVADAVTVSFTAALPPAAR